MKKNKLNKLLAMVAGVSVVLGSCMGDVAYAKDEKSISDRLKIAKNYGVEE